MPHLQDEVELARYDLLLMLDALDARVATLEAVGPVVNQGARVLGSDPFQLSLTRPAIVYYIVELTVVSTLISAQTETVQLLSDANNPPTTLRTDATAGLSQTVGLSVTLTNTTRHHLFHVVPPGDYVILATSGTGTATLVQAVEVIL